MCYDFQKLFQKMVNSTIGWYGLGELQVKVRIFSTEFVLPDHSKMPKILAPILNIPASHTPLPAPQMDIAWRILAIDRANDTLWWNRFERRVLSPIF
jgi:hypothetical protein